MSGSQATILTEWADLSANETANTPHTASGTIKFADADTTDSHTASFTTCRLNRSTQHRR